MARKTTRSVQSAVAVNQIIRQLGRSDLTPTAWAEQKPTGGGAKTRRVTSKGAVEFASTRRSAAPPPSKESSRARTSWLYHPPGPPQNLQALAGPLPHPPGPPQNLQHLILPDPTPPGPLGPIKLNIFSQTAGPRNKQNNEESLSHERIELQRSARPAPVTSTPAPY